MLKNWTLGNFKSVAEPTELDLAAITVLAGANSSGKSTVLQSILAVSQTLRATTGKYPLILNGEYVRLGYLTDAIHNRARSKPVVIGFVLDGLDTDANALSQVSSVRLTLQIGVDDSIGDRLYGRLHEVAIEWRGGQLTLGEVKASDASIWQDQRMQVPAEIQAELQRGMYTYVPRAGSSPIASFVYPFLPQFDINNFLPGRYLESYDRVNSSLRQYLLEIADILQGTTKKTIEVLIREIKQDDVLVQALRKTLYNILSKQISGPSSDTQYYQLRRTYAVGFTRDGYFEDGVRNLIRETPNLYRPRLAREIRLVAEEVKVRTQDVPHAEIAVRLRDTPSPLDRIVDEVTQYFRKSIYYLGPLREAPQYLHILPPYPDIRYVGTRGEYTAAVLERYQGEQVDYPLPPGTVSKHRPAIDQGPLIHALQIWLEHMGLLEKVKTLDRGKMGTEMTVRASGVSHDLDLTSIGVGVSQVLPTLVGCLIAPRGTTFLLEQPELHLHPRVQAALSDFFIGLTHIGKQVVIETHSEYMINRLRRRVAEDEEDTLVKDIRIYFVERESGRSSFRSVNLTEYGATMEWPKGFFDEGPTEAQLIMEAAMSKRLRKMAQKRGQERA